MTKATQSDLHERAIAAIRKSHEEMDRLRLLTEEGERIREDSRRLAAKTLA